MTQPYPPVRRLHPALGALFALTLVALAGGVLFGVGSVIGLSLGSGPGKTTEQVAGVTFQPSPSPTAVASASAAVPSPPPSVAPSKSPGPSLNPPPAAGPFAMDLYDKGDFVTEKKNIWCVPAAMQTMINIMKPSADRSMATQERLFRLARSLSPDRFVQKGAEPEGWAAGLTQLGYGKYVVHVEQNRDVAIKVAAKAIRMTGRPAGLVVWRGAHSWVMSGFKATADPAYQSRWTVTHVYIEDVWYPRVSSIWGASRPPDSLVPVGKLGEDYLRWKTRIPHPGKDNKYVVILPVAGT